MVPRTKEESIRLLGRGTRGAAKRPQTAPGPYNARVQTSSGLRASHGNQSHFPYYVRESGQGLRGLCPQGEPRRAVRVHRGRGAAVRRALLGGSRPRGGAHQGRVSRREAHLPAAACDPAHRRGEEARRGQDHRDGRRQRHGGTVPGADVFDAARREEVKQPSGILGIAGTAALSPFRGAKLLERLRAIEPAVTALDSRFMHFVECTRALTAGERAVLLALLTYGPRPQAPPPAGEGAANRVLVVPRAGTISPWSSKATDIARVCGLEPVRRIERGIEYRLEAPRPLGAARLAALAPALFDRMTEMALLEASEVAPLFAHAAPRPLERVPLAAGRAALVEADRARGLALSAEEIDYLLEIFARLRRDPSDVELTMFAQVNSEHCRHKIFNARWIIDGEPREESLFAMIRYTHERSPAGVLSAYRDNAAVIEGSLGERYFPDPDTGIYRASAEPIDILMKVETHNHPTAISPFPGASTGSGGEIRDEGATGRGAKPKAGLTGFSVSHLRIPGYERAWEREFGAPARIASPLDIMIEAPIGAASFNNEFGRAAVCGYFRTFEQRAAGDPPQRTRGYHKPIMIAGGLGNVRRAHVEKAEVEVGAKLVVLGGPAMLIGLGGGAASSLGSGSSSAELDFASVQRGNAEMQRRAQEVIDRCWALGDENPIALIHDVGAGGLSNAVPEAVAHSRRGARVDLRAIPSAETGMSPMELWCNEAQERYVLAIPAASLPRFAAIAERERCPFAVIGEFDASGELVVRDPLFDEVPVDMPLAALLGEPPRLTREVRSVRVARAPFDTSRVALREAAYRVLRLPAVADKTFLITIGDRTVGGLISRDQLVGRWQVAVSDVAVTLADYRGSAGEALAMGERTPVAVLDAPASGRLAVAEAITNILAADIGPLSNIRLSANWMAACGEAGEDAAHLDEPSVLLRFAAALAELHAAGMLRAYHDRSDGGLFATLLEMAFAGHCGLDIALPGGRGPALAQLFAEEPGVVVQILAQDEPRLESILARHGLADAALYLGAPVSELRVRMRIGTQEFDESWADLRRAWSETSWRMRRLRDDPECADEEFAAETAEADPGLSVALRFDPEEDVAAPYVSRGVRPALAILREQGVNSQTETAAVCERAGFAAHDVHMSDLLGGRRTLGEFQGLIACGGFSYGDVLGAGEGWAKFESAAAAEACASSGLVGFRYVTHDRRVATTYPANPSGSPFGLAALTNTDGRVTITMPHPERSVRYVQNSWRPRESGEWSGWMRLFRNARRFAG